MLAMHGGNDLLAAPVQGVLVQEEYNRQGIQFYEQGQLAEALRVFGEAMNITPNHTGLNLNFLQALLKHAAQSGGLGGYAEAARGSLKRLEKLTEQHRQYKRYQHLLGRFNAMNSA